MKKHISYMFLLGLNIPASFASIQPALSIVANTPTSVSVNANRHAYVQYKVTNNTNLKRTLTMLPIPHVSQMTTDTAECQNPFTLLPNQSCNLTLYVEGSLQNSNYFGGPTVCKTTSDRDNTPNPYLCFQPEASMTMHLYYTPAITPTENKLYVSNWTGNTISLCYIDTEGNLSNCLVSATSSTFLNPEALAISNGSLFVANIGGGISSCLINSETGELTDCNHAISDGTENQIHSPDGIAIQGTTAYISNAGPESSLQGVTQCTVNGASLHSCVFTQGNADFNVPSDLALFNNTVYITNFNALTTYCPIGATLCVTPTPGSITGTEPLLNQPEGLFIATINSTNYAYFTNHGSNAVTLCTISGAANFSNCTNTEGYFKGFGNLAILTSQLKAFIPSGSKSIATCDVSSTDGTLSNCVNAKEIGFSDPSGLVIN